ncbi:MAG: hypothetical protein A2750_03365 [Candidatus Yanofskybacteria bacterium RIFCSPHIGHO2_01_FULL_45_42]|uniref:Bacterial surface antigen (D15) domain-containing protein n=3 Tax=Candidatus Yanofskyibacteriota TaxID=1752733 RepID=A0A1F8F8K3_9BACT|nr:MAG: hypothetical protein A2750_03365 [Candidatus Yanofskybacteria bacterium RIFCSPHIGHO2_01_FULL_45_42]OGN16557.1 MAG: hypothetical protein A3C81_00845 [Candidatus Yanofskybacteria bacterium RIFCSPHIGHO2_02_FULL_46_19]OGN32564.1 MAG: hypothetical protein A3J01_03165 [Candidatus Yanofskybacteria bacterium RIFCSPLOWO2_02_FULL_45_18]
MKKLVFLVAVVCFLAISFSSEAQFGKNKVIWERVDRNFYRSEHFDIWLIGVDLKDAVAREHFGETVAHLENSYDWFSHVAGEAPEKRLPAVIYRTHSELESTQITGEILPEGVGAFAESVRNRVVLKLDFYPALGRSISSHEQTHIFQFFLANLNIAHKIARSFSVPDFLMEGGADYLGVKFAPYTRDDIRRIHQRIAAGNPEKYLPSWEMLTKNKTNPYAFGSMVFLFLEGRFSETTAISFMVRPLKEKREDLLKLLGELTGGIIDSQETFDRMFRDFWAERYAREMLDKPKPYQETANFKGRSLTIPDFPFPLLSPSPSPDGKEIAAFTIQKNGVVLVVTSLPPWEFKGLDIPKHSKDIRSLTRSWPLKHYEYVIAQRLETWPFNGFDLSWSRDSSQIAFFARKNRDHTLFIVDSKKGNILWQIEVPFDQAFSPAFGLDNDTIYFSAAKNLSRNIYSLNLKTGEYQNLTEDGRCFNTAPILSPDGKKLVYVAYNGDFQKIWLLDLTTFEKTQLTFNRSNEDSPSLSDDGSTLLFTGDDDGGVWNIYTIDMKSREVRQRTNLFGGAFTPRFFPGSKDRVVYTAYWQYDQYKSMIYPNFEVYEATFKEPVRIFAMVDKSEPMQISFRPETAAKRMLDEGQLNNPEKPPKKWYIYGRSTSLNYNTYWGMAGGSNIFLSSILEDEHYVFQMAASGKSFRLFSGAYLDQRRRMAWGYGVYDLKIPLFYLHYNISEGGARQPVLNLTASEQYGARFFGWYPLDKFNRLEMGLTAERRNYDIFVNRDELTNAMDKALYDFLTDSNGGNVSVSAAYVRDKILYSQNVQGPIMGHALRLEFRYGPSFLATNGDFLTLATDARHYNRISDSVVLAKRVTAFETTHPNGEIFVTGGADSVRGYSYGSIVGSRGVLAGAELRFPIFDALVIHGGYALGPFRGILYADYAYASFASKDLKPQKGLSYGLGMQFLPFNFTWSRMMLENYKRWRFNFYYAMNY